MPLSSDPERNRAFYWALIIGVIVLFVVRSMEILIRLSAVGVYLLVLKFLFDSFYETLRSRGAQSGGDDGGNSAEPAKDTNGKRPTR